MAQELPKKVPMIQGHIDNIGERYMTARQKMAEEGIQIRHVRPVAVCGDKANYMHTGGLTVAFRQRAGNSFIEVATAVCSIKDTYCRKVGTVLAVEAFMNDRVIRLPNYTGEPALALIDHFFDDALVLEYGLFD